MRYFPHTEAAVRRMLATIGAPALDQLFASIPAALRLDRPLALPPPAGEADLLRELEAAAATTAAGRQMLSFLGAGIYPHYQPAAIDQLLLRQEFYTAYTPYQPEISQGTLQAVFEFQTMIAGLFGLDVANASVYDGATAVGEAALMARRLTKGRSHILFSQAVHPEYRAVARTYLAGAGDALDEVPAGETGLTDPAQVRQALNAKTYAVAVQYPNFLGQLEDLPALAAAAHDAGALLIVAVAEPLALGWLKPPGDFGADIVAGEGQSFGIAPAFGGPSLGLFATRGEFLRQLPGRVVGETTDADGQRGFVLTLATREQHIRREKATSNICTNVGLNALAATIYLALLGRTGLRELARRNAARAAYLTRNLDRAPGYGRRFPGPCFNEIAVRCPKPAAQVLELLAEKHQILAGVDLGRWYPQWRDTLLICTTELHRREDLDRLLEALASVA